MLRSGWLTSGHLVKRFEVEFAAAVGAKHAVALNSATAALHLAVEALGRRSGHGGLVPAMTFAATDLRTGRLPHSIPRDTPIVGVIPVHVGGLMLDMVGVQRAAGRLGARVVEDAAHAFPEAWRAGSGAPWQRCGENTAAVSCFSFYANKTITTCEGGMAVTSDEAVANRMRLMSLHGLAHAAWGRFREGGGSDYRIGAPGFKYNLTDIAAAIGVHQLAAAEQLRERSEHVARRYVRELSGIAEVELPPRLSLNTCGC